MPFTQTTLAPEIRPDRKFESSWKETRHQPRRVGSELARQLTNEPHLQKSRHFRDGLSQGSTTRTNGKTGNDWLERKGTLRHPYRRITKPRLEEGATANQRH